MSWNRGIFVIAGYGAGKGTGSASAEVFSKAGYKVALIGRDRGDNSLVEGAEALKAAGGDAHAFPLKSYTHQSLNEIFSSIKTHWPKESIRVTLWNASFGAWKGFLDTTPEEWKDNADTNVVAPAAFARESILAFKGNDLTPEGARGILLFTGATASIRGNKLTSCFSTGKHALRALSQSLSKEFGKENIHVAHAIIDGGILTERSVSYKGEEWVKNVDGRLEPGDIAQAYLYLAHQGRSAWSWEIDLRPAHENW